MKDSTFYNISSVLGGFFELLIIAYLWYLRWRHPLGVYKTSWRVLIVAVTLTLSRRLVALSTAPLCLFVVYVLDTIVFSLIYVFMAVFVNTYASFLELKMVSFKKGKITLPKILQPKFYNSLFYGSITVSSTVAVFFFILFFRSLIWPKKYDAPDSSLVLAILSLLVIVWDVVAIYVTTKFIKALKGMETDSFSEEGLKIVLKATKTIRWSMIGFLTSFLLIAIATGSIKLSEMMLSVLLNTITVVGFFIVILPFINAIKISGKFKEGLTQKDINRKSPSETTSSEMEV